MGDRIRVQVDSGVWETLGVDRDHGAYPEAITPTYNAHGPDGLTFNIARDGNLQQSDLDAFTPIEWLPDGAGEPAWEGYITDGPASADGLTISAVGWQHYIAEDAFSFLYAHQDLTEWQDVRGAGAAANLGTYVTGWTVTTGGEITINYAGPAPSGSPFTRAAVILDTGQAGGAQGFGIDWILDGGLSWNLYGKLYITAADTIALALAGSGAGGWQLVGDFATVLSGSGAGTLNGRYVVVMAETNTIQDAKRAARITGIKIFGATSYEDAFGNSILKASDVVKTIPGRYPLLNQDLAQIDATTLVLRQVTVDAQAGATVLDRVNGYHAWRWFIDRQRRLNFHAQPSAAALVVDLARAGADWTDASATSGLDLYNRVVVTGATGSGQKLEVIRTPLVPNALTRRGRTRTYRLQVAAPTDATAMAALGDAFLATKSIVPLRGTLTISADNAVRRIGDDAPVPVADLGRYVTELVTLANLIDPTTGALARTATIAGVTINPDEGTAAITVDNTRDNFAALLARMFPVLGQG
jgi:hypothetical protein